MDPARQDAQSIDPSTETIRLAEEVVHVGKRLVETGRTVVRTHVEAWDETVDMLLEHRDVTVERVSIGRTVTEAPPVRQEGDVWIVPVLEERLVVEKRLVLTEELHIRTVTSQHPAQQTIRLRRDKVSIEELGADAVAPPS